MLDLPVVLAQQAPAAPASLVATVFDMVVKGGWIMVPLGICSLVAVTIAVERFIVTRPSRVAPPGLAAEVRALRADPQGALTRCERDPSSLAALLAVALRTRREPRTVQEARLGEAGQRQVQRLRNRMRLLSALPQSATMLGLLGTVMGMIRTFTVVASSGEALGKTERLAQGIYEAWTATAAGLVIAIPTLLAYHVIMSRIDAAAAALESAAAHWLESESVARDQAAAPTVMAGPPSPSTVNGHAPIAVEQEVGAC